MATNSLEITDRDVEDFVGREPEPVIVSSPLRRSSAIGQIAKAMAAARKKFKPVKKDSVNPHYKSKYADISALIDATYEALSDNDLVVIQSPSSNEHGATVTTMIAHGSGEWFENDLTLPAGTAQRFDSQTAGSAITYGRRYSYQAMLNIAGEDDDDGNAAVTGREAMNMRPQQSINRPTRPQPVSDLVTSTQRTMFWNAVNEGNKSKDEVLNYFGSIGIEKTEEMQRKQFEAAIAWARGNA
jgi:hypothetical protein